MAKYFLATFYTLVYMSVLAFLVATPEARQDGQSCTTSDDCLSKGFGLLSRCYDGECQCFDTISKDNPQSTIYDSRKGGCALVNSSGETPPLVVQDLYSEKDCEKFIHGRVKCKDVSGKKICACENSVAEKEESYENGLGSAVSPLLIEDECVDDTDCTEVITGPVKCTGEDENRFCKCEPGFVSNYNRSRCVSDTDQTPLPDPLIGESCASTAECEKVIKGPVQCKDKDADLVCQCDAGYEASSNRRECVAESGSVTIVSSSTLSISLALYSIRMYFTSVS